MFRHQHHNLLLHDDSELASLLGADIGERTVLHEWPLSSVHRVVTRDGRKAIYKSQSGPTVEPEFYARARSPLLPRAETIYRSDSHACMLLEFVDGPSLEELHLPEEEVARHTAGAAAELEAIEGDVPYFLDVSGEARWLGLVEEMTCDLSELVAQGRFALVTPEAVCALAGYAGSAAVVEAAALSPGLVHGDLGPDNLFVLSDGYRVIDWQRPLRGPMLLNYPGFCRGSAAHRPEHACRELAAIAAVLQVNWLTQCAREWIPDAADHYDAQILHRVTELRHLLG